MLSSSLVVQLDLPICYIRIFLFIQSLDTVLVRLSFRVYIFPTHSQPLLHLKGLGEAMQLNTLVFSRIFSKFQTKQNKSCSFTTWAVNVRGQHRSALF